MATLKLIPQCQFVLWYFRQLNISFPVPASVLVDWWPIAPGRVISHIYPDSLYVKICNAYTNSLKPLALA